MPNSYLDRLNTQYDEIRAGIDTLVNRAAEENRDVTEDEQTQVDRDQARLTELQAGIQHYTELETNASRVMELRGQVRSMPQVVRATPAEPDAYDISREFPSVADYAICVHRAMTRRDPEAQARLDRATAHQTLADNPGIVPRPILGPVLNTLESSRPFVQSIVNRPLPAGKFDRPRIDQHVAVAKQAAEKDLTASQKMTISLMAVTASTYAGHLNISRQDIKWTSPSILQIVFDDFANVYAVTTCGDACSQFVASVTGTAVPVAARTAAEVMKALYTAQATSLSQAEQLADTLWVAPDIWGILGSMTNTAQGGPAFPSLSLTSPGGNPLGLRLVVDAHFPAGTMISGPSSLLEFYEDVDGLMQVGEPDVLGQLVGYAGYAAFLNLYPGAFTKFTMAPTE